MVTSESRATTTLGIAIVRGWVWRFPRFGLADGYQRGHERSTPACAVRDDTEVTIAEEDNATRSGRKIKDFQENTRFSRKYSQDF